MQRRRRAGLARDIVNEPDRDSADNFRGTVALSAGYTGLVTCGHASGQCCATCNVDRALEKQDVSAAVRIDARSGPWLQMVDKPDSSHPHDLFYTCEVTYDSAKPPRLPRLKLRRPSVLTPTRNGERISTSAVSWDRQIG